jgi:sialic acid synthase SpsE|tara:strand:+ start:100 stop:1134 length:1035 start_codon:yes stop_codon:yes gene_type:complete
MLKKKKFRKLRPYLIAEIGVNHECCITKAKKMINECKLNGADAVKFQYYKSEKIASIKANAYWDLKKEKTNSQFDLFKKYDKFDFNDYLKLSKYCKKKKIDFLCTAFDLESSKLINPLVKYHKIASADLTNIPLVEQIATFKKPIFLSTGASTLKEISKTIKIIKKFNKKNIFILHCVLNYPTDIEKANLRNIEILKKKFKNVFIGYSDHTIPDRDEGCLALKQATNMGSLLLEKHYTYNKKLKGNDHYHSMDRYDLLNFTNWLDKVNLMYNFKIANQNKARQNARRRICAKFLIKKNHKLKPENLIALRSNKGILIDNWHNVIGKRAKKDLIPIAEIYRKDIF